MWDLLPSPLAERVRQFCTEGSQTRPYAHGVDFVPALGMHIETRLWSQDRGAALSLRDVVVPVVGAADDSNEAEMSAHSDDIGALAAGLISPLEHLPDPVLIAAERGLIAANRAARAACDGDASLTSVARVFGDRDVRTKEAVATADLPLALALQGKTNVRELLLPAAHADEERVYRCVATPVVLAGHARYALVIANDMTERERASGLEKKRSDFEQQLIGIVSHDLRNPLQVIRLSTLLTVRDASDPALIKRCERVLGAVDRAVRMVDDLLDFTRIRFDGGLVLTPRPTDLHALTAQVVEEVSSARPERVVRVEATGDGRGHWDADRLAQVVQNLVVNALQHTTEDTVVSVRTCGNEQQVVLEVHNGGTPISAEDLPRLFAPFQRGNAARRGGRSLGLGLYISARIVETHAGSIAVRSNLEEGTTFSVRLPRSTQADEERET